MTESFEDWYYALTDNDKMEILREWWEERNRERKAPSNWNDDVPLGDGKGRKK